jgi:hypothetical protein
MSDLPEEPEPSPEIAGRNRRRLRGFLNHLIILLLPVNVLLTPGYPWFVFPLVAWGAPLAIHAAYAMGLFDRWRR